MARFPDIPSALHHISEMLDKLDRRTRLAVSALTNLENTMASAIDHLRAAVTAQTTVTQGVVTLLQDLNTRLREAIDNEDSDAIEAIAEELEKNTASLASAVVANTPVGGEPAPVLGPPEPQAEEGTKEGTSETKVNPDAGGSQEPSQG